MASMTARPRSRFGGQFFLGLLLIGMGPLLLADNFSRLDIGPIWRYVTCILILLGVQELVNPKDRDDVGGSCGLSPSDFGFSLRSTKFWVSDSAIRGPL